MAAGGSRSPGNVFICTLSLKCRMVDVVDESPKILGVFVRERRQAAKLTQRELAELAGVGTRLVSDLERGKPTLRMDVVNRVLQVFGRMVAHVEAPRAGDNQ